MEEEDIYEREEGDQPLEFNEAMELLGQYRTMLRRIRKEIGYLCDDIDLSLNRWGVKQFMKGGK